MGIAERWEEYRPLVRNRDFVTLTVGRLGSALGSSAFRLAVIWWALTRTGSALDSGLVVAVQVAASTVIAPVGGVLVDRVDRKRLLVGVDFLGGVAVAGIGLLSLAGRLALWHLLVAVAVMGVVNGVVTPATKALMSGVFSEEELNTANSIYGSLLGSVEFAGPAVAGALVAVFPFGVVFLVNAGSYLLAAAAETLIRHSRSNADATGEDSSVLGDLREGFGYVLSNPTIRRIVFAGASVNLFVMPTVLVTSSILEQQGYAATYAGMTNSVLIGGTVVAGTVLLLLPTNETVSTWQAEFFGGIGVVATAYLAAGATLFVQPSMVVVALLGLAGLAGFGAGTSHVTSQSVLQATADESKVGKVFGFFESVVNVAVPVSYPLTGYLLDATAPGIVLVAIGTGSLVTFVAFGWRPLADLRRGRTGEEVDKTA